MIKFKKSCCIVKGNIKEVVVWWETKKLDLFIIGELNS